MNDSRRERKLSPEEKLDAIATPISERTLSFMKKFLYEHSLPEADTSLCIALKILDQLDELGMSKGDLAEKLGVTQACVTRYVSGKCNFTLRTLVQLEKVLGINLIDRDLEPDEEEKPSEVKLSITVKHQYPADYLITPSPSSIMEVAEPAASYGAGLQREFAEELEFAEVV